MSLMFFYFRTVKTLYNCVAENDAELSFEADEVISNGECEIYRKELKV